MKQKQVREPIATWWKLHSYRSEIEPLRVVAFTASFVIHLEKEWSFSGPDRFRERRERRDNIFPTFAEAKANLIGRAENRVAAAKEELQRSRTYLGQAESLKEPSA